MAKTMESQPKPQAPSSRNEGPQHTFFSGTFISHAEQRALRGEQSPVFATKRPGPPPQRPSAQQQVMTKAVAMEKRPPVRQAHHYEHLAEYEVQRIESQDAY